MTLNQTGIDFLTHEEGIVTHPYRDSKGIPTIGVGFTFYPDTGKAVTMQDPLLSVEQVKYYFSEIVKPFETTVLAATRDDLTQNEFNALVSLCYNIGQAGFAHSTVAKLVNQYITGEPLKDAFCLWKKPAELLPRRIREYNLYIRP